MNAFGEDIAQLALHDPGRIVLIDGAQEADAIENEIWKTLCSRFPVMGKTSKAEYRTRNI